MIKILYFAVCQERTGIAEESMRLEGLTTDDALTKIIERHPSLADIREYIRVAVNHDFATDDVCLKDGDELALIPPVAGGDVHQPLVIISEEALELAPLRRHVRHDAAGAEVIMVGMVRNHAAGERVTHLKYEAYVAMAEKVIDGILHEVEEAYPEVRSACAHRIGNLAIGDDAVIVCCSSPHRAEAFAACQRIIDRLKEDAPIWKHEHRASGEVWVGLGP